MKFAKNLHLWEKVSIPAMIQMAREKYTGIAPIPYSSFAGLLLTHHLYWGTRARCLRLAWLRYRREYQERARTRSTRSLAAGACPACIFGEEGNPVPKYIKHGDECPLRDPKA